MMLDASISCAGLPATQAVARGAPAPPPFAVSTVVIEGDSITSAMPSTPSSAFYSYRYADSRPDRTIAVRAQGSRLIGTEANLDDDSNSLMGNVAEDMAYGPDLITTLIGANDMTSGSAADYKTNLAAWYAAVKAARPECRVAWSAPIPYNPNGEHPTYANFTAQRAIVMADARDPAVWGQWADYYLPLGEHPDWVEIGSALYGDTVHPTGFDAVNGTGGQNRLYDQFKAAIDSIADATRVSSTAPYESVWPADEDGLAANVQLVRRFVISGIAHKGLAAGVSVSGGEVRLNGGAYGSSIGRIYNGDVIDLKLTTSEDAETATTVSLTIGSETRAIGYTTGAEAAPVEYAHGGVIYVQPGGGTTHTFENVPLAGLTPLIFTVNRALTSVTLTPSGGGDPINATQLFEEIGDSRLEAWLASVLADDYDIAITLTGWSKTSVLCYRTVRNANPVPAQVAHSSPGYDSPPHLTPAMTVPANGLALVFFAEYGGASITPATANSPTVLVAEGHAPAFEGETIGVAIGIIPASGQGSFQFAYGNCPRGGVVFAAARGG
jgi:lysophospholipase L1-like esterase